jgi:hypothetical protein
LRLINARQAAALRGRRRARLAPAEPGSDRTIGYFTQSMGSFTTTAASTITSVPPSAAGSSGFSSSGFSGGGAGGGGGW